MTPPVTFISLNMSKGFSFFFVFINHRRFPCLRIGRTKGLRCHLFRSPAGFYPFVRGIGKFLSFTRATSEFLVFTKDTVVLSSFARATGELSSFAMATSELLVFTKGTGELQSLHQGR